MHRSEKKIDDDCTISYRDDPVSREELFERVIEWMFVNGIFSGESVYQKDVFNDTLDSLMDDIITNILEVKETYDDEDDGGV